MVKTVNFGYELTADVVLTKAVPDSPVPTGVAMFERLVPGAGGSSGGGGGGGTGVDIGGIPEGMPVVVRKEALSSQDPPLLQPLVHATIMKFRASPNCFMKHNGLEDFPPHTDSLKALLFATMQGLEWTSVVAGTMQGILLRSDF